MKRFYINEDDIHSLGLTGSVLLCYTALRALCANPTNSWKGSYQRLSDESGCGSRMTAERSVSELVNRGLIKKDDNQFCIAQFVPSSAQNVQSNAQNVQSNAQNEQFSKEKESAKEKENNIKEKNNVVFTREEEKKTATPNIDLINRLFFMDTLIPADKPAIPANTGYYKIIVLEYGYLNPKKFVDEFYHYWDGQGWPERGNKLSLMRSWMDMYKSKHPKQQPNLNETERLVLRTFLDNIEQRLVVRLFNVVRQFEVTDKLIIFYVPEQNQQDFVKWLNAIDICKIFAAYNREIKIRISRPLCC